MSFNDFVAVCLELLWNLRHLKVNVCISKGDLLNWLFYHTYKHYHPHKVLLKDDKWDISRIPISYVTTEKLTLSKQTQSIEPETLMTLELMQDILYFLRRLRAYNFPIVMVAGRAGGITMVIISRAFKIISPAFIPRLLWNQIIINEIILDRTNFDVLLLCTYILGSIDNHIMRVCVSK